MEFPIHPAIASGSLEIVQLIASETNPESLSLHVSSPFDSF